MTTYYNNIVSFVQVFIPTNNNVTFTNDLDITSLKIFYIMDVYSYVPYFLEFFFKNLLIIISLIFLFIFFFKKSFNPLFSSMSEKELNAFDDIIIFSLFLVVIYFSYIFYMWGLVFVKSVILLFYYNYLYFGIFISLLLLGFLINMGLYFVAFIKGASNSLSLLNEFLFDWVNILSFNIRAVVQILRLIIVYISYLMLLELYTEYTALIDSTTFSSLKILSWQAFIVEFVHLFIEIAHTIILFFMQIVAFSFMIFWLFQFLVTCFLETYLEN